MIPSWDLLDRNNFLIFFGLFFRIQYGPFESRESIGNIVELRPEFGSGRRFQHLLFHATIWRSTMVASQWFFLSFLFYRATLLRSIYMGICIRKPLRMSKHFIEKWLESGFRCRLSWTDQQSSPPQAILRWSLKVLNFLYFPRVPFYAFKTIYYYQRSF